MDRMQDKKEKIFTAGSECFARYGYEKTSMDDIGRLVWLNKASLYYYYNNKEVIFSADIFLEREKYTKTLQESINQKRNLRDKVVSYMTGRYLPVVEYLNL